MTKLDKHTLKIKCPTWDHVVQFCTIKVKKDGLLSARVSFVPIIGETVAISLELPDSNIRSIEAKVLEASPAPDGVKIAVKLVLVGLTVPLREELLDLAGRPISVVTEVRAKPPTVPAPVPLPEDAPIDEVIVPLENLSTHSLSPHARELHEMLSRTATSFRDQAAHEILGIRKSAEVDEIRDAYFSLVLKFHPDQFAKHGEPALSYLATEAFIFVARAYDRMREHIVAQGRAIAVGPSLIAHKGWMAGFEDIGTIRPRQEMFSIADALSDAPSVAPATESQSMFARVARSTDQMEQIQAQAKPATPAKKEFRESPSDILSASLLSTIVGADSPEGSSNFRNETVEPLTAESLFDGMDPATPRPESAPSVFDDPSQDPTLLPYRQLLEEKQYVIARDELVKLLRAEPRNRLARSLYHVALAGVCEQEGKAVEALSQLETALAHDPANAHAQTFMENLKRETTSKKSGLLKRWFQK